MVALIQNWEKIMIEAFARLVTSNADTVQDIMITRKILKKEKRWFIYEAFRRSLSRETTEWNEMKSKSVKIRTEVKVKVTQLHGKTRQISFRSWANLATLLCYHCRKRQTSHSDLVCVRVKNLFSCLALSWSWLIYFYFCSFLADFDFILCHSRVSPEGRPTTDLWNTCT